MGPGHHEVVDCLQLTGMCCSCGPELESGKDLDAELFFRLANQPFDRLFFPTARGLHKDRVARVHGEFFAADFK